MRTLGVAVGSIAKEASRKGMFKQSENIAHRLFNRQICRFRPNTHIHQTRKLYENIVPGHTIYDVDCPDHSFRKFTNDGQYLICFSRNHQDLIVYRHKWLNYCVKGEFSDQVFDLPPKCRKFESYFSHLYTLPLACGGSEIICKDFFLSTENGLYGIFATSTVPDNPSTPTDGAIPGVPSTEKITISIVSLAEGQVTDQRAFHDDFIQLAHNMGIFLYDDMLAILSIRFQCIRVLQVRETGKFVDVRTIGAHCREDDELVLNSQAQDEELYQEKQAAIRKARGLPAKVDVSGVCPPTWNLKQPLSSKREHRKRGRNHDPNPAATDPSSSGLLNEVHNPEFDMQYDDYFRGLFASLEDTAVRQMNGHGVDASTDDGSGRFAASGTGTGSVSSSRREMIISLPRQALTANVHAAPVELRTAPPLPLNFPAEASGRNRPSVSTSWSGGRHSSAGPSQVERTYTSTSGESIDRYTSGRGSSPTMRYTSTTVTSASDSGSRSESSRRRDASLSAGSLTYGNGPASVQPTNGFQYVVSSRTHDLSDEPFIPNGFHPRGFVDERRSFGGNFMDNGQSLASIAGPRVVGNGQALEHRLEHRWIHGITGDPPNANDRSLPVRFSESVARSTTVITHREVSQAGAGAVSRATVSVDDDGTTRRGGTDVRHRPTRPARNAENSLGSGSGLVRNRAAAWDDEEEGKGGDRALCGIKQRLLSFIIQGVWDEDTNRTIKAQHLKRFYYHFQHYVDLVIWKVQFLDRYHLLIKFGSIDGVLQRNSDTSHQTAFLAVYNLETTEMLGFYQNSSEEFLLSFEQFCDHFRVPPQYPLYMNYISSYSNNSYVRDQLHSQRVSCGSKVGTHAQVVKRTLAWVPFNAQCQSPSVYFDQSLFHYDEKLISAIDRHKPCMEHPIKFISRRRPNLLKFKINPGPEFGSHDGRTKRVASFIFHPIFPFAISIQQSFMQPPILNIHVRK